MQTRVNRSRGYDGHSDQGLTAEALSAEHDGGLAGVVAIALVVIAIGSALTGSAAAALVVALILVILGTALYGLGQALERLLDADPEDES